MARFCIGLKKVDKGFVCRDLMAQEEIRGISVSKIMNDWNKCHPAEAELASHSVERMEIDCFKITGQNQSSSNPSSTIEQHCYTMRKNRFACNAQLCLVRCERCPNGSMCAHQYTCTCPHYAYRNVCKHVHILVFLDSRALGGANGREENVEDFSENYSELVDMGTENILEAIEANTIENEQEENKIENEQEELASFLQECDKIDQKTRDVRKVLRSADYSIKEKRKMMEAFRKPFASVINTSPLLNPLTFPRLDRKRVHEPQNRSFFPRKLSKPNPKS